MSATRKMGYSYSSAASGKKMFILPAVSRFLNPCRRCRCLLAKTNWLKNQLTSSNQWCICKLAYIHSSILPSLFFHWLSNCVSRWCTDLSLFPTVDRLFNSNEFWPIMPVILARRLEWAFPSRSTKVKRLRNSISGETPSGNDRWR